MSLFNDGFGDDGYRMVVADTALHGGLRNDVGYVTSAAQCGDEVWAVANPDVQGVAPGPALAARRIIPRGGPTWTITAEGAAELSLEAATCHRGRLTVFGSADKADRVAPVVATVDLMTGQADVVDLGREPGIGRSVESGTASGFAAATTVDGRVYVAVERPNEEPAITQLYRVDPVTGRSAQLAELEGADDSSDLLLRFEDDHLFVLDATEEVRSVLTAIDLDSGEVVGRRTIDPVIDQVNGRFTSFEEAQFVRDFVVLRPVERW